jgi:broad specificity phosphatase PhoE
VWNARGLWQGHADPPLSPQGLRQARGLVRALADERIDRIESSDLRRARQTAAPLAAARGLVLRTDPLYRELDLGEWSGLTGEQIAARGEDVFALFQSRAPEAAAPGGESRSQLRERALRALESLCERCRGERVVVVTHGGFVYTCFPEAEAINASVHRERADVLLERVLAGGGVARTDAY